MVWKTNFDRHLDEFVLAHIERGETQLQHETEIFADTSATAVQQKKPDSKVQAAKKSELIRAASPQDRPEQLSGNIAAYHVDSNTTQV